MHKNKKKIKMQKGDSFRFGTGKVNMTTVERNLNKGYAHTDRNAFISVGKGRDERYFELGENDVLALKKQIDEYVKFYGDD